MMILKIRSILLAMLVVVQILTLPGYTRYANPYPHPLGGTTYYVDRITGNDKNSGLSEELAWKTIAKVNASSFFAGDSILFKRGQTWREALETTSSGMPGNPITFGAYGRGARPTFDGADILRRGWERYSRRIYRHAVSNDPERTWWGNAELAWSEGNYATLGKNEADWDMGYLYVNIGQSPNGEQMKVPVRECGVKLHHKNYVSYIGLHFTRSFGNGITQGASVSGSNIVFDNCVSDYNGVNGLCYGIGGAGATYFTLQKCQFNYNGHDGHGHGAYLEGDDSWTVQNNIFIGNANFGLQIQNDSNSHIVRYNYFEDNGGGAIVLYDGGGGGCDFNQIYYNAAMGGLDGIWFGGTNLHTGNLVYNNVFYNFTQAGLHISGDSSVGIIKNNIFWSAITEYLIADSSGSAGMTSDHNCIGPDQPGGLKWHTVTYDTLAAYITATGMDTHSISSNPAPVATAPADFHLKSTSPCINSGTDVGLTMDYFGNSVPVGHNPDIGIHEYPLSLETGIAIIREIIASMFRSVARAFPCRTIP